MERVAFVQLQVVDGEVVLEIADTVPFDNSVFVYQVTVDDMPGGISYRKNRFFDNKTESHEWIGIIDTKSNLFVIGARFLQRIDAKVERVVLFPAADGGMLIVAVDCPAVAGNHAQGNRKDQKDCPVSMGCHDAARALFCRLFFCYCRCSHY